MNNIHFCENGVNVLVVSAFVQAGWSMRVELASTEPYHDSTHTSVRLQQIRGKYYVDEQNIQVGRGIDLEQELFNEEILPMMDPIEAGYDGGQDHE